MVRCPKVPVYKSSFFFSLVALEPLVRTQWRFLDEEGVCVQCTCIPRMAPRGSKKPPMYFSWFVRCPLEAAQEQCHHFECRAHPSRARSLTPAGMSEPSSPLARPSTCTQCARQNRPGSPNLGCSHARFRGGQGLAQDQRVPSVGVKWEEENPTGEMLTEKGNTSSKTCWCGIGSWGQMLLSNCYS